MYTPSTSIHSTVSVYMLYSYNIQYTGTVTRTVPI